ncbi:sulfatase-like hydrolase/transferase [Candidatus Laterigemmans baculatus]|uniref:sulfatase-like hydrolase/transferase n=1 Tax=Candidatus Laterigemmans baculatus TaxID=2770505 RepID=UPI0013DB5A8C|nr:sulfatase-like hydrolase/transferase [Candidatus Laterigemmans baculatus]
MIRPLLLLAALALGWMGPAATQLRAEEPPNILFVFADDQSFSTIAALGNSEIETPNLDRLARRGTVFSHSFNMGSWSGAVCVASRTMLNSGRSVWRANEIYRAADRERAEGRWWSELMKQAGYRTYMTGKWHVPAKADLSFDVVADVRGGMPKQTEAGYGHPAEDPRERWSPSDPRYGGYWEGGTHWSEVVGNHATDFLADASKRDEPFFMYIAFNAPHDPRQSPQAYVDRYPAEKITVPASFQSLYPFKDAIGCGESLRDERLAPFPRTPHDVQIHRQEYYAIITHMDAQIGRILDALEDSGKADNTWIFFTADHGLACGEHGLMGKQNLYDHSVRVPFVVVGPGVPSGATIETPVYLQDVMPTTLELAGLDKPDHVEFHSLLPLLAGETHSLYPAIYGAYLDLQRSIRTERYKLIVYPKAERVRLYDLQDDPQELRDLAEQESSKPLIQTLYRQLKALQKELGDDLELDFVANTDAFGLPLND